jgi:Multimeric flavodoxin WrbA
MKATIIMDKEHQTDLFNKLQEQIITFLSEKGFQTELICIGRDDLAYCMGCFGCWIKKPGECVISDMMAKINHDYINSDTVIYLSPVIFGQFSANIKNAIDRSLPNVLPFFKKRHGSTIHPPRYDTYPKQIIVGYGDHLDEEDQKLFTDIIKKHLINTEVLIYQNAANNIHEVFNAIEFKRVGGYL